MAVVAFDTLKLPDRLQAGGFTAEQARTAASAFAEAVSGYDLATKADVIGVASRLELVATKAELREVELRLEAKIEATKADILRWMFGAMAAQTALIVGLVKLVH
ncbi:MAG: hypothetical protein WCJ64_12530 [Rhodospirillaceae bacterium]